MMNVKPESADENLPAIADADLVAAGFPVGMKMAAGLAILFNPRLYDHCKKIAALMSQATGMMPGHLIGKPAACFAVVSRSITWNLDPFAVAQCTYETPGSKVGFEGKLIQSILENSGRLEGGVKYTHYGDWSKVKGKFKMEPSTRGGKSYPVPTWTREDAGGMGVKVSARVKGEAADRELDYDLDEAFPLNSTLWATKPHQQICYTAVRAFANVAMPGILMGVPFDVDPTGFYGEPMTDITPPRPTRSEFDREPEPKPKAKEIDEPKQEMAQDEQASPVAGASPEPTETHAKDEAPALAQEQPHQGEPKSDPEPEPEPETPLARGTRLLPQCQSVIDVSDLRNSIMEEIEPGQIKAWVLLCDERSKDIMTSKQRAKK